MTCPQKIQFFKPILKHQLKVKKKKQKLESENMII